MVETAVFALLHVLVFVYWLGGDLGAFYSSRYLTAPGVSADRRLMAAKIVGDVDMAPRTALILALPTGLWLADTKGWLDLSLPVLLGVTALFLVWLAIAWQRHFAHGKEPALFKHVDTGLRWATLLGLTGLGIATLAGQLDWPLFLGLKCLLLALAVAMGLFIRRVLAPFGPALMKLNTPEAAAAEADLARLMARARPLVLVIWASLITAAFLGLWTPV